MSNIDKQALREVAERATPGNWRRTSSLFNGITVTPFSLCGEEVTLAHTVEKRDAEFIAAANPATMLALLDELETKEEQRANWFRMAQKLGEDLDTAERLIAELDQRLIEYAGIATREARRVAELEARKVNLSKLSVGVVMHMSGFSRDYAEGWCAGNDNAIHEIRTAGIKVKGCAWNRNLFWICAAARACFGLISAMNAPYSPISAPRSIYCATVAA
ncbi:ead/Ea22-like family protein [Salmonella enterica]|uniref:ead/Ea22-like family protein n=2 Tax=Salmonella enterica TaxID=28901 RepID=UPI0038575966